MSPQFKKLGGLIFGTVLAASGVATLFDSGLLTEASVHVNKGQVFLAVLWLIPAAYFLKQAFMSTDKEATAEEEARRGEAESGDS